MNMTGPPEENVEAQPPPASDAYLEPVVTAKPKTDVLFFILGLITPAALYGLGAGIGTLFRDSFGGIFFATLLGLTVLAFLVFLFLWLRGKKTGNVRLRSYGKGGMWSYAAIPLFLLLAFGTCLINPP